MFEDVKEKIQLIKDLMKMQERIKNYVSSTTWDTATFSVVTDFLEEIVSEFEAVNIKELNVVVLNTFIDTIDSVTYLPYLNAEERSILNDLRVVAVEDYARR